MSLRISSERADVDVDLVHRFLHDDAYWCRGVPRAVLETALEHSLCYSAFVDDRQVGFARVISDQATFAYLCDVFVLPEARGQGVSKRLMDTIVADPRLQGLRRFLLATADAHRLYAQYGFAPLAGPDRFMERYKPDVYRNG